MGVAGDDQDVFPLLCPRHHRLYGRNEVAVGVPTGRAIGMDLKEFLDVLRSVSITFWTVALVQWLQISIPAPLACVVFGIACFLLRAGIQIIIKDNT